MHERWQGDPDGVREELARDPMLRQTWRHHLRLASDGQLEQRLAREPSIATSPHAHAWRSIADAACAVARSANIAPSRRPGVPFAPLLDPWIAVASAHVEKRLRGRPARTLWHALRRDAIEALALELSRTAARAWFVLFDELRLLQPHGSYAAFILGERMSGYSTLGTRYPAVIRALGERTHYWICNTATLIRRLTADQIAINTLARPHRPATAPTRLRFGQSDSHRRGQRVVIVEWEDGASVVYKPRSLAAEQFYADVVGALVVRGLDPIRAARVVDRRRYGWMEFIVPQACANPAALERYAHHAGTLLAVVHVLGIEDLHRENIIAAGEHPVLIDLEVMLRADLHDSALDTRPAAHRFSDLRRSIAASGLLPMLAHSALGAGFIDGGLWSQPRPRHQRRWGWVQANSDQMSRAMLHSRTAAPTHMPRLGEEAHPVPHQVALLTGFREAMAFIVANRSYIMNDPCMRVTAKQLRTRLVFRATAAYAQLLERAAAPCFQHSGLARSIELDVLTRPTLRAEVAPAVWPAIASERRALERGDVPYFWMRCDRLALESEDGLRVPGFALRSGVASALHRIAGLTEMEIAHQAAWIQVTLTTAQHFKSHARIAPPDTPAAAADAIAAKLLALDVGTRAEPAWHSLGDTRRNGVLAAVDDSLGLGRAGIALFLAQWARRRNGSQARHAAGVARATLYHIASQVQADELHRDNTGLSSLGVVTGAAGVVFALAQAGADSKHTRHAMRRLLAQAIAILGDDPEMPWDWYAGSAGLLAVCAAIQPAWANLITPTEARVIAQHVRHGVDAALHRSPKTLDQIRGIAHGALGGALALARWARVSRDPRSAASAARCLRLARQQSVDALSNQKLSCELSNELSQDRSQDLNQDLSFTAGWCRGFAGESIADGSAARLLGLPLLTGDDLCCGSTSVIDALLSVRGAASCASVARALLLARASIARAHARRSYRACAVDDAFFPTCWNGIAGIGYTWLRFEDASLPGLLALQPTR